MPITEDELNKILTKILQNRSAPIKSDEPNSFVSTLNSVAAANVSEPKEPSERPKRCEHTECKKKLMLSDLLCKCERYYCQGHRYAESHSCTFDYKGAANKILEKQLVKTVAQKISQI